MTNKFKSFWGFIKSKKALLLPALTLSIITGTVALMLSVANTLTADVIADKKNMAAEELRKAIMPGADEFIKYEDGPFADNPSDDCFAAYADGEFIGYIFNVRSIGNSAGLYVKTAIGSDGVILNVAAS